MDEKEYEQHEQQTHHRTIDSPTAFKSNLPPINSPTNVSIGTPPPFRNNCSFIPLPLLLAPTLHPSHASSPNRNAVSRAHTPPALLPATTRTFPLIPRGILRVQSSSVRHQRHLLPQRRTVPRDLQRMKLILDRRIHLRHGNLGIIATKRPRNLRHLRNTLRQSTRKVPISG